MKIFCLIGLNRLKVIIYNIIYDEFFYVRVYLHCYVPHNNLFYNEF